MVMLILCILLFSVAFLIIDRRQVTYDIQLAIAHDEYVPLTDQKFDNDFGDSVMTQYLLGLGEFETDAYGENSLKILLWVYFLGATLLTQIIFFNILIAVLADTYSNINDSAEIQGIMQRTEIHADWIHMMKLD